VSNTLWAHGGGGVDDKSDEHTDPANVKIIDRVCEMQIDKDRAKTYKKDGHKYYFCSKKCKKIFKKNPEKYACICPPSDDGCNCYHCTGTGELCDCAEITVYMITR
jgi:YHS domain-containing protein